jgi:hypothetical protein
MGNNLAFKTDRVAGAGMIIPRQVDGPPEMDQGKRR